MNASDKEQLNRELKTNLGITADKNQFIISQGRDLQMHQFSFDMAGLDLAGKLDKQYLLLADFFNVPKNILTTDTDSTYENQSAALKRFYTDCIAPLCEVILEVGRMIIRQSYELVPSEDLSFVFDNVDVLRDTEKFSAEIRSLLDLVESESLDEESKSKLRDVISNKIADFQ